MMFKLDRLYKHRNSINTAFKPTSIIKTQDSYELYGMWYNISYGFIIDEDWILVKEKDLDNWKEFDIPEKV